MLLKRAQGISGYQWARVIKALLDSGLIVGRQIVAVGHSAGATGLVDDNIFIG